MSSLNKFRMSSWADANDDDTEPVFIPRPNAPAWKGSLPSSIAGNSSSSSTNTPSCQPSEELNETVSKYITPEVRLADSDGDIRLFHYVYCDDESPLEIKSTRGIIRDGDQIVCKTFGFTSEISCAEKEKVEKSIHSLSTCKFFESEEGATIRLWYDFKSQKWRLSTHRKIDAYRSRWGNPNSRSFGDMFLDALHWECVDGELKEKFTSTTRGSELFHEYVQTLDKNKNYTYLVRNSEENRIVCDPPSHPQAFFIGSFDRKTHFLVEGNDSGFPFPQSREFSSIDELIQCVSNMDPRKKQGIIVYMPDQTQVKIMNAGYLDFFGARGNEPSIKFRYLQVRKNPDIVSMLYTLYPDYIPVFEMYENLLSDVARKIHRAYINRYIQRQFVSLPQPEFYILQACHAWHIGDRIHNKISLEKVRNILDMQSATSLNKIIKPYLMNKPSQSNAE